MDRLRGITRTEELGRRVANAVSDVADLIVKDIRTDVPLVHLVRQVEVPGRIVTDAEYTTAKKVCGDIAAKKERAGWDTWVYRLYRGVCDRYKAQHAGNRGFSMEMHVLRLGDVAIATNPFELYLDYGVQIQARSPAEQTFLIQLAAGPWSGTAQRAGVVLQAGEQLDQAVHEPGDRVRRPVLEGAEVDQQPDRGVVRPVVRPSEDLRLDDAQVWSQGGLRARSLGLGDLPVALRPGP